MANTVNVTALPEYVNVHKDELLVKSALGAKTLDYVTIMPNVKYKDQITVLDSEIVLAGAECGWNPQGTDTYTPKYIEVAPIEVEKEFCWLDYQKTAMNHQLNYEAGRETLPFEEKLATSNMNAIQDAVEVLVWQGDENLGIDGFLNQMGDDNAVVDVKFEEGQAISEKVDAVVAAIPFRALKKNVNIFMSYTDFRAYVAEANSTCCANRPLIDAASESIVYSGDSRIKIVPVLGLEGTGAIVAAPASELVYATDIEGAENVYKMWFDQKEDKFLFKVLFAVGTALRFSDEIVLGMA